MDYAEKCLSKGHAFFFRKARKKRETRLFFASFVSFFPFVSLFQISKPRENELLPSSYFPHHHLGAVFEKVITEKTTTSEDVIYILTHTHV